MQNYGFLWPRIFPVQQQNLLAYFSENPIIAYFDNVLKLPKCFILESVNETITFFNQNEARSDNELEKSSLTKFLFTIKFCLRQLDSCTSPQVA